MIKRFLLFFLFVSCSAFAANDDIADRPDLGTGVSGDAILAVNAGESAGDRLSRIILNGDTNYFISGAGTLIDLTGIYYSQTALDTLLSGKSDTDHVHASADVSFDGTVSGLSATTAKTAIDELASEKQDTITTQAVAYHIETFMESADAAAARTAIGAASSAGGLSHSATAIPDSGECNYRTDLDEILCNESGTVNSTSLSLAYYSITVTDPGNANVISSSDADLDGDDLDCGDDGSACLSYAATSDVISITATAATGYEFTSWGGSLSGSSNPADLTVDGVETVTATFSATTSYLNDASVEGVWYLENGLTDSSDASNDLSAVGSPTYGTSSPAQGTYYGIGDDSNYFTTTAQVTGSFSAGGWFRTSGLASNVARIFRDHNISNYGWAVTVMTDGDIEVGISGDGTTWNSYVTTTGGFVSDSTWVHLTVVVDGSYVRFYVDGSAVTDGDIPASYSSGVASDSGPLLVASGDTTSTDADEVFVFNRALSAAEVLDIYTNGCD